jgi:polyhydroxybutyrate depolymerase
MVLIRFNFQYEIMTKIYFFVFLLSNGVIFAQNTLISENFESNSLPDGWSQQTAASDGGWNLGTAGSLESDYWSIAPHGNIIGTNDDDCDCDKSQDYLILPPLDLSATDNAILEFQAYYDGGTFEGDTEVATIEYSLDGGNSWTVYETIEGSDDGSWSAHAVGLGDLVGNSDVLLAFRYNDDGGWMFGWALDDVVVYEPTGLDAAMTSLDLPSTVNVPSDITISGTVSNLGAEMIEAMDISWSDGEVNHVETFSGLTFMSGTSFPFTHEEVFTMSQPGSVQLEVTVSNVNGMEDDLSSNNTLTQTISALEYGTLQDGGINRDYIYYHPGNAPANCPLVFVCHGYTGSAQGIMNYSEFNALADEFGFAVCYPQGIDDSYGNAFWNVGYDFQNNETVDDVAFLIHLTEYLEANHSLDTEKVFCTGMSNGGDFCYLLACEAADHFRAVAPIAGMIMQEIMDACNPSEAVSILEIHGTQDNVTYFNGDPNNADGWGAYPSIPATMNFFVNLFGLQLEESFDFENLAPGDGSTVSADQYGAEGSCTQVRLYTVDGGGHDWPGAYGNMDIDASREAWLFFQEICDASTGLAATPTPMAADRKLIAVLDLLGRKASPEAGEVRLHVFSDGSVEKRIGLER